MRTKSDLEDTKKLMGALLRQPPKQHDEMKVGKESSVRKIAKARPSKQAAHPRAPKGK